MKMVVLSDEEWSIILETLGATIDELQLTHRSDLVQVTGKLKKLLRLEGEHAEVWNTSEN